VRDWPILLVAVACIIGTVIRYVDANQIDAVVGFLAILGSAAFGAWIYSMGVKDGPP
jgi:hypothetical protein